MRSLLVSLLLVAFFTLAIAQKSESPKKPSREKPKSEQQAAPTKPVESAGEASKPGEEKNPEPVKPVDGSDKEERFDVAEIPPVVTPHQITVDGKVLKYTATAGRLPLKRPDGKIEAEIFFVAYTLDGLEASK